MARSPDFLGATGIGVSDLQASATFYKAALGLQELRTYKLDYMDEIILAHEGRTAVVLMHWTDGSARNYKDVPVKLVFYVTDPVAVADRIRKAGGTITLEPAPLAAFGGAMVGLGKDPDGYVIELLQAPEAKAPSESLQAATAG
ncbi:MAG: VOC family protein [Alphaproteobacteria bacterium]|nr:VOC family protein [Alphaproteobacteria bacterium]MBU1513726.1 VOC family protein [Alphaproteobacteria bacterium]MBU2094629.1 VOC family protein [Alphaproteobacteria bacterium]MBU2150302.1 VOC family protein [Alphaproteobacteria bacterium]MBU2309169.1 VOC family protein [Alphaproteobacteria bacterium]